MEKVKTKLAVWSWAREQGLDPPDRGLRWIALLDADEQPTHQSTASHSPRVEGPLSPPNTARPSVALSPQQSEPPSASRSPKWSEPPSPLSKARIIPEGSEDDADDPPLELKVKPAQPRLKSASQPPNDYLTVPVLKSRSTPTTPCEPATVLPRQLSNLAAEETHFKAHRNSIDLLQHQQQNEGKINQHLMNARDSIILTKSKLDTKYPKSVVDIQPARRHVNTVSSTAHAPSTDARSHSDTRAVAQDGTASGQALPQSPDLRDGNGKVDECWHEGCPICEVERPRWFGKNCMKGPFM
jgi:hypothetical protein